MGFCQRGGTFVIGARAMPLAWFPDIIGVFAADCRLIDPQRAMLVLAATPV